MKWKILQLSQEIQNIKYQQIAEMHSFPDYMNRTLLPLLNLVSAIHLRGTHWEHIVIILLKEKGIKVKSL
jgi:hypothetical protein